MSVVRIYQPGIYEPGQTIALSVSAAHHVAVVLRMRPDDPLVLFRGDDQEYSATMVSVRKSEVLVRLDAVVSVCRESSRALHLAQGISKGDRMAFVIQKAVELGVASITPILTRHSVVRLNADRLAKKQAQWEAIAIGACEQSGRTRLPVVYPACALDEYLNGCQSDLKLILSPKATATWRDYSFTGEVSVLVGPEGGFSDDELCLAEVRHCRLLGLGPRILRTETAAISVLSVLQAVCGDL